MTTAPTPDYAARRATLARQIGPGGIAIVPTAAERPRNRDNDHPYRFDSYFHYLTGFGEPQAWLVVEGNGHSTLLLPTQEPGARNLGRLPPGSRRSACSPRGGRGHVGGSA